MRSYSRLFMILLLSLTLLLFTGCGSQETKGPGEEDPGKSDEVFEFSMASHHGAEHAIFKEIVQVWAERVEEATDGRVKITLYPGETLLKGGEIFEGVVKGVADIGHDASSYTPGRLPLLTAFQVGGLNYHSSRVVSHAAYDVIKKELVEMDELADVKILFCYGISPGSLHIVGDPVKRLEDLKGREIRTISPQALELLGGVPVSIPMPETYEALERGVVDGILCPLETLEGWRHAEVTKSTTLTPFISSDIHLISMNKAKWEQLPADLQEIIEAVNEEVHLEVSSLLFDKIDASAVEFAKNEANHEFYELSLEEQERWIAQLEPMQEVWIKEMEAKGLPGREMLDTVKELFEKYIKEFS